MAVPEIQRQSALPEVVFLNSVLCQCALPRRSYEALQFTRRNGAAWIAVQAGQLDLGSGPVQRFVPSGAMPRLLLAWLNTQLVRSRYLEFELGETPRQLLKDLGLGGQAARYSALQEALLDLAAARFQFGWRGTTTSVQPIESLQTWKQGQGVLRVGQAYAQHARGHAVPLERRALAALAGSALALDLYTWLASRLCRLEGELSLSWPTLHAQLGQEYTGTRAADDFRRRVKQALPLVLDQYPAARVTASPDGLLLRASAPPISRW